MERHELFQVLAVATLPRIMDASQAATYAGNDTNLAELEREFGLVPTFRRGEPKTKKWYDRVLVDEAIDRKNAANKTAGALL